MIEEIVAHFQARKVAVARLVLSAYAETPERPEIVEKCRLIAGD
ncbi:MAG: hypothetical protein ABWX96_16640 [Propionibacteriaceae bacterium]